ncbi:Protein kinase domain - like 10 [Theobroma cacao]|nr:Protein kinase domain - like 10 [Theobroma cacao]
MAEASRFSKRKKNLKIIIVTVLSVGFAILGFCLILLVLRKKKKLKIPLCDHFPIFTGSIQHDPEEEKNNERGKEDLELPLFDFDTISKATDNFSQQNKLGQGGFGPLYKKPTNEETYLPDQKQSILLDWPKRFQTINGISRGLLYLHQDSRLRIIHRDLKAGNILLDYEMNPKISDFGLARSFGGNETEANTNRVVGTYGYMSPEYAIDGWFSIKSDVFSFGVLVLEIVSGRRNRGFSHPDHNLNLLGHVMVH